MLVVARPDDVLDREADVAHVAVGRDVDVLQVVHQRRARVPRHVLRAVDHVVAVQRRDGNQRDVRDLELRREVAEIGRDRLEGRLVVVDQVHLVDARDQVADADKRRDVGVAARLLEQALARVDQDHGQVGSRCTGDHVARVLNVARGVCDHEATPRRREVAVSHVDRDALLALGAQAVGQQGQVDVGLAAPAAGLLDVLELVLEDLLRVEEQAPDQGGLAVVDRADDRQAQLRRGRCRFAEGDRFRVAVRGGAGHG